MESILPASHTISNTQNHSQKAKPSY